MGTLVASLLWASGLLAAPIADPPARNRHEMRTLVLPGVGYIRFEVLPGEDEEPAGEVVVMPARERIAPVPAVETAAPARKAAKRGCEAERGKLVARILQETGLDLEPDVAAWLDRETGLLAAGTGSSWVGGAPLLLQAVRNDPIARELAIELYRCQR